MSKKEFDFKSVEEKWKGFWEKERVYKFNSSTKKKIYSIDTPPPTVSGKMHIGHALSYSQQDFIARFVRMFHAKDGSVFYPFGTDDNGLPTERLIEKANNVKSKEMSRSDFIKLCLKTLKEVTPDFIQDWKDLGMSCDFDIFYSTIDKNSQKISQKSFIELFKKKEVYKDKFPVIWCPECQTAIAQAELEDSEQETFFSTLKFELPESKENLLIATTRPELLGACVAVFINPKDKKNKKFIGKKAMVPIFNQEVPILADESADMEKGTGVLMICSYGDKFDVDAIQKHKINPNIILNEDGTLNVKGYEGLKIKEARKKISQELKDKGLIKEQKKISHVVNVHDKCGTEIEFIPTEQWFVKVLDKKNKLVTQGNKIKWHPEFMKKRYDNWVNGLDWDWNISRNRHFGIPIPVWECAKCKEIILPKESELPVDPLQTKKNCPKCNQSAVPEDKVLDTWATSSLTPQIASSLIKNKIEIPYSLRPNGHDIIRTWAFYTIVKSLLHDNKIPWRDIAVSGMVSLKGEKMSKSKGNVIDLRKVMEEYGADALRFWAAGSKLGSDLDYQEKDLVTGKKMINKLRNASKFVFMNLEDYKGEKPKKLEHLDELFLNRLQMVANTSTSYFEEYEYSHAKSQIEQFFWSEFCDNYLEIVKKRVYQGSGEKRLSAQYVLYKSLLAILKMIAPIMPFITEEIYQEHFKETEKDKSIHISEWPSALKASPNEAARWALLTAVISKVRQEKSKNQKPMNAEIILTLTPEDKKFLTLILEDLKNVTNAREIKEGKFKVEFVD